MKRKREKEKKRKERERKERKRERRERERKEEREPGKTIANSKQTDRQIHGKILTILKYCSRWNGCH